MCTSTFTDAFINIFLASLLSSVSAQQEDNCRLAIQTIEDNYQSYCNSDTSEMLLCSLCSRKVDKDTSQTRQLHNYSRHQYNVYADNTDMIRNMVWKYKQDFSTADAWKAELANIRHKIVMEGAFNVLLSNYADDAIQEKREKDRLISAKKYRIHQLTCDLQEVAKNLNRLICLV